MATTDVAAVIGVREAGGGLVDDLRAVRVARPSLDDVFMSYTGTTIRDAEATATDRTRTMVRALRL